MKVASQRGPGVVAHYGAGAPVLRGSAADDRPLIRPEQDRTSDEAAGRLAGCDGSERKRLARAGLPGGRAAASVATGRPADVLQLPDGSVLISDDTGNRLLRVSYQR